MKRVVMNRYPSGELTEEDFRLEDAPLPLIEDGELLVRTIYLGIEPRQRTVINPTTDDNREMRPAGAMCAPGKVIPGSMLGEVMESNNADYQVGDIVEGFMGWTQYAVTDGKPHPTNNPAGVQIRDRSLGALEHHLGIFGLPGITPLLALRYEGKLKPGETMVVTTAAGMVGCLAAQLGRLAGARVVGLTSRDEKCAYLLDELGLDGAINYRDSEDLVAEVAAACPEGIDYFFDNCGGPVAEAVKTQMKRDARYTGSGFVAHYNESKWGQSDKFRGMFMVHHYVDEYPAARRELADLMNAGKLGYRITFFDGIETAPGALIDLLKGRNIGKYLVRVGPDSQ
jgi:NADPH-dependent curcumin reductase CurA